MAPVDVIVVLRRPDEGLATTLATTRATTRATVRELSTLEAVQAAVEHALPLDDSRVRVVTACAGLLGDARGYELTVGDSGDTAEALVAAITSA